MQKLHLVMGGRVRDPQGLDFTDLRRNLDHGRRLFPNYASAGGCLARQGAGQRR